MQTGKSGSSTESKPTYHAQRIIPFSQLVATSAEEQDDTLVTFVSLMQYPVTLLFSFKHNKAIITRSRCARHPGGMTSGAIIVITTASRVSVFKPDGHHACHEAFNSPSCLALAAMVSLQVVSFTW